MWDLIVSVPDRCLSFYFVGLTIQVITDLCNPFILFLQNKDFIIM